MVVFTHLVEEGRASAEIALTFEWRVRTRFRQRTASGEWVGFHLPRGTILRDGDLLASEGGRVLRIQAAEEILLEVHASSAEHLTRIAYHLGNRHVAVQVSADFLRLQVDHVLEGMVLGLGGQVERIAAPFDPETGAYGHGAHADAQHDHSHDHMHDEHCGHQHAHSVAGKHDDQRHAPKIHDFLKK
jgi:urease accessory protein